MNNVFLCMFCMLVFEVKAKTSEVTLKSKYYFVKDSQLN